MTVFACISIALLLVDARMRTLSTVRQVAGTVLYPLQMAALLPRDAFNGMGDYFYSLSAQWEHTLVVTPTGYEVMTLSAGSPTLPEFVTTTCC